MRHSVVAQRLQSKMQSSLEAVREALNRFDSFHGGCLPVSDYRRAFNLVSPDCVLVLFAPHIAGFVVLYVWPPHMNTMRMP